MWWHAISTTTNKKLQRSALSSPLLIFYLHLKWVSIFTYKIICQHAKAEDVGVSLLICFIGARDGSDLDGSDDH